MPSTPKMLMATRSSMSVMPASRSRDALDPGAHEVLSELHEAAPSVTMTDESRSVVVPSAL